MRCPEAELIGALFDGELDGANTASVEYHLTRCDACRRKLEDLESLRAAITANRARWETPERVSEAVERLIGPEIHEKRFLSRVPSWIPPCATGALAASLMFLAFAPMTQQHVALDQELISDHVRSLQPTHLLDVETSSRHVVKPWFNGRVDFSPSVPELADVGFPLAGGRLDSVDGKTAAAIVYRRKLHVLNLFIWRSSDIKDRRFERDGFAVLEWSHAGLRYAVVSDIDPGDLHQFEEAYKGRAA